MFAKLKKFILGDTRPIRRIIVHPVIGHLIYSDDDEAWLTDPKSSAYGFGFYIAGDWSKPGPEVLPPAQLIEHAAQIASNPNALIQSVQELINAQLKTDGSLRDAKNEVEQLHVYRVMLMWPERPNDGEIELRSSPDSNRMWHCAYINGKPAPSLVFSGLDV